MFAFCSQSTSDGWGSKGLFDGPSCFNSFGYTASLKANSLRPNSLRQSFFVETDEVICAPIGTILFGGRPFAVLWAVVAIIVDSINLMFRRGSFPHIVKKPFERLQPLIANGNAATAVARIHRAFLVFASAFHGAPDVIFWRLRKTMGLTVLISNKPLICEYIFAHARTNTPIHWITQQEKLFQLNNKERVK